MNKVEFTFEGDVLVKNIPCPQFGEGCYQSEVVIDKETFLECMKRWMKKSEITTQENLLQTLFELESENERLHDAFDRKGQQ